MQAVTGFKSRVAAMGLAISCALANTLHAEVPSESVTLGDFTITIYLHPFLTQEDLTVLRFVTTSTDALALFVPSDAGHAAIAVSPDEGFVKGGVPMPAVIALGGLPDGQAAQADSLAACQRAAASKTPCVVVLQIAPN